MSDSVNQLTLADVLVNSGHRYRKECMTMPKFVLEEVFKYLRMSHNLRGMETETTIKPQGKWRPYHSEKVVDGTGQLTARTLTTYHLEMLEEFDPEALYSTIFSEPLDVEKVNMDMVKRLLVEEMRNAAEGLFDCIFQGVRNANGTDAIDSFDGFDTIIKKEKTAGNISLEKGNMFAIGEMNVNNIGDKLRLFYLMIDPHLRGGSKKKLQLWMPSSASDLYDEWHATRFGSGIINGIQKQKFLHGTENKVEIISLPGMEGMDNIWITEDGNMRGGDDFSLGTSKFRVRIPDNPNLVQMSAHIYLGVNFAHIDKEFLMVASCKINMDSAYAIPDVDEVAFADTTASETKTAVVNLQGFNLTSSVSVSIDGDSEFTSNVSTITADDANADGGKDITITFAPLAEGEYEANLILKSETDDIHFVIPVTGKGLSAGA